MKLKLILAAILSAFLLNSYGQIEVNSSGNVGIGVTPGETYKLDVLGKTRFVTNDIDLIFESNYIRFHHEDGDEDILFCENDDESAFYPDETNKGYIGTYPRNFYKIYGKYVYGNNVLLGSDERLKENIRPLISPLEKIKNVRGVKFDFISTINPDWNESKKNEIEYMDKNRIGFIAQELNEVFPELVKYDEKNDAYSVDYIGMIPVLVEAIKEQQSLIEELQYEVGNLKSGDNYKSASITSTVDETIELNTLFQNSPNPFSESTEIEYYISEDIQNAYINIYDLAGTQLKSVELHLKENGSITINGGELRAGIYLYTLITDGKVVDSKQMVLTD